VIERFERCDLRFEIVECSSWLLNPCVTFEDDRFDYGEERLLTLGLLAGRLVVIPLHRAM